jgi:hypothetical protein
MPTFTDAKEWIAHLDRRDALEAKTKPAASMGDAAPGATRVIDARATPRAINARPARVIDYNRQPEARR